MVCCKIDGGLYVLPTNTERKLAFPNPFSIFIQPAHNVGDYKRHIVRPIQDGNTLLDVWTKHPQFLMQLGIFHLWQMEASMKVNIKKNQDLRSKYGIGMDPPKYKTTDLKVGNTLLIVSSTYQKAKRTLAGLICQTI